MSGEPEQDPRITPDTCPHTFTGGLGIEWVCIKPATHAPDYVHQRRRGMPQLRASENAAARAHYMVPRYPGVVPARQRDC